MRVVVVGEPDDAIGVLALVLAGACSGVVFPGFVVHSVDVRCHVRSSGATG